MSRDKQTSREPLSYLRTSQDWTLDEARRCPVAVAILNLVLCDTRSAFKTLVTAVIREATWVIAHTVPLFRRDMAKSFVFNLGAPYQRVPFKIDQTEDARALLVLRESTSAYLPCSRPFRGWMTSRPLQSLALSLLVARWYDCETFRVEL